MVFLRKQGVKLFIYIDDLLITNAEKAGAISNTKAAIHLFEFFGFLVKWEKSFVVPTQRIQY